MTKLWALFVTGVELEKHEELIVSSGFEVEEVKKIDGATIAIYFGVPASAMIASQGGLYAINFNATEDEYNAFIQSNEFTKVW